MRPIKFRVWHKLKKLMFSVKDIQFYGDDMSAASIQFTLSERAHIYYCELMQFTGLLDKNGKEIYEGDITYYEADTFDDGPQPFTDVVTFEDGAFRIQSNELYAVAERLQIIGNIYENPELLKDGKAS